MFFSFRDQFGVFLVFTVPNCEQSLSSSFNMVEWITNFLITFVFSNILEIYQILLIYLKVLQCFPVPETKLWLFEWYLGVSLHAGSLEYSRIKFKFANIGGAIPGLQIIFQNLLDMMSRKNKIPFHQMYKLL